MSYGGREDGRLKLCKHGEDSRYRLKFKVFKYYAVMIYATNTASFKKMYSISKVCILKLELVTNMK
jgi:hypothetical protein